jgi:hypothetical protein
MKERSQIRKIYLLRAEKGSQRDAESEHLLQRVESELKDAGFVVVQRKEDADATLGLAQMFMFNPKPVRLVRVIAGLRDSEDRQVWQSDYWEGYKVPEKVVIDTPEDAITVRAAFVARDLKTFCEGRQSNQAPLLAAHRCRR